MLVDEYKTVVTVDGVVREHDTWQRDLTSSLGLPEPLMPGRTSIGRATIVFPARQAITGQRENSFLRDYGAATAPWRRAGSWPPRKGALVRIEVHHDGNIYPRFTGVVEGIEGGLNKPITVKCVDAAARLDAPVSYGPMTSVTPYITDSKATYASTPVTCSGVVNRVLMDHVSPLLVGREVVPLLAGRTMGAVYARVGDVLEARSGYFSEDKGLLYFDGVVTWRPLPVGNVGTFIFAGYKNMTIHLDGSKKVQIISGRDLRVLIGSDGTKDFTLPDNPGPFAAVTVQLYNGRLSIFYGRDWLGAVDLGSGFTLSTILTYRVFEVYGDKATLPAHKHPVVNVNSRLSTLITDIPATRTVISKPARDLISDVSDSACIGVWVDEEGVWQVQPLDRLFKDPIAATLTTRDDLLDFSWSESAANQRDQVIVDYSDSAITRSNNATVTLWEGSRQQFATTEEITGFITPGSDEEWVLPDETFERARSQSNGGFNSANGSWWGVSVSINDSPDTVWLETPPPSFSLERITSNTWKYSITAPQTANTVKFFTSAPTSKAMAPILRDQAVPILRGWCKAVFTNAHLYGTGSGTVYRHQLGAWGGRSDAKRLLDFLTPLVQAGLPVLETLPVRFNTQVKVGQKIRISSKRLLGVHLTGLIAGIHDGLDNDGRHVMALDVFVVDVIEAGITYDREQIGRGTYKADQADREGLTYGEVSVMVSNERG
ncbi:hypothetical protein ACUH93_00540 [Dermabacteraceae bacterium P7006]